MSGTDSSRCPKCGTALSAKDDDGLCWKCLGRSGLALGLPEEAPLRLGDYELLEEIARGGMGVVYRARQLSLKRIVAVKILLNGPFSRPDFIRRFRNEAEATAALRHPNIVPVYEVGEADGHHFLSMEYVEGQNFAEVVRPQPLDPCRAARYLKTIAEAVHHAHQRGVLHRDLKPSNVLLDAFDQPRVTDFGLAKMLNQDADLTLTGQVFGSPNHMPPEQAGGNFGQTTAQSDVYSLGSILYQLLTGQAPFQGVNLAELLVQVQTAEPLPPRQLNPAVPADLQSICLTCLRKEPERRYASAQALADDLALFCEQKPVLARPISGVERLWLWVRRRPILAGLALALGFAVVGGFSGILWQWRRAEFYAHGETRQRQAAERNAAKTRLNLYAADISLAAQALNEGDFGLARQTLNDLRPQTGEADLRGFEWRHLWHRSQGDQLATLKGHSWIVTATTFSPDGRHLVSGGVGGEVKVWDVRSHECQRTVQGDARAVWSVEYTSDGGTLMSSGIDGTQFWRTDTWQPISHYPGQLAALSSDDTTVAIADSSPFFFESSGSVALWNWREGKKLRTLPEKGRRLRFSPDGRRLAIAGVTSGITLWDVATGERVAELPTEHSVWSLAFSPNGQRLLSAGWCGQALDWDLSTHRAARVISSDRLNLWSAIYSADATTIVTVGSDQSIRLWDADTLQLRQVFKGHSSEVWCASLSADGKLLATGGKDQAVMLWNAAADRPRPVIPCDSPTRPFFSPDGHRIFTRQSDERSAGGVWQTETAVSSARFSDLGWRALGYSLDGEEIVALGWDRDLLEFWTPGKAGPNRRIGLQQLPILFGGLLKWGIAPTSGLFFGMDSAGTIRLWKTKTGELVQAFAGPKPPIRNCVLDATGRWLAVSVERENTVHLFNCTSHQEVSLVGHKDFVSGLAFSPDSAKFATGSMDGTIRLWNIPSGSLVAQLAGHMQETTDLAFAPDGQTLASIAEGESLKLWHVPTLRKLVSWDLPRAGVWLQFSPDQRLLAVGTLDHQIFFLEAPAE